MGNPSSSKSISSETKKQIFDKMQIKFQVVPSVFQAHSESIIRHALHCNMALPCNSNVVLFINFVSHELSIEIMYSIILPSPRSCPYKVEEIKNNLLFSTFALQHQVVTSGKGRIEIWTKSIPSSYRGEVRGSARHINGTVSRITWRDCFSYRRYILC